MMGRVPAAEIGAPAALALRDRGEIVDVRRALQVEAADIPEVGRSPGGAADGLGGPAAVSEAVGAQEMTRHQGHFRPQAADSGRTYQSVGAAAGDHRMVAPGRQ